MSHLFETVASLTKVEVDSRSESGAEIDESRDESRAHFESDIFKMLAGFKEQLRSF
jgi:hypothetical protein